MRLRSYETMVVVIDLCGHNKAFSKSEEAEKTADRGVIESVGLHSRQLLENRSSITTSTHIRSCGKLCTILLAYE